MGPQSLISSSIHESKGELIERNERDWWVGRPDQQEQWNLWNESIFVDEWINGIEGMKGSAALLCGSQSMKW